MEKLTFILRRLTPFFILLALGAVTGRIILSGSQTGAYVLGYFTLQSNIMVILWLAGDFLSQGRWSVKNPGIHDALTLYILMTGLVYNFFLAGLWNPQGWDLVTETINHTVTPAFFLLRWVFTEEQNSPPSWAPWASLSYPLAYGLFGAAEGTLTGKFRYFFLDYLSRPLSDFLVLIGAVTLGFILFAWGLRGLRRLQVTL